MCTRVVRAAERSDVAAANVFGDDAADRFDHTVSYTADAVDGDDVILVVIAVVGEVVGLVGFEPSLRLDVAAGRVINDQEDGGKEPFNKWRGKDGADASRGLIETGQETDSFEGPCCSKRRSHIGWWQERQRIHSTLRDPNLCNIIPAL